MVGEVGPRPRLVSSDRTRTRWGDPGRIGTAALRHELVVDLVDSGYALADSPVGMLAFFYDKFIEWTDSDGEPETVLTRDEILDNVTLYWFTNTGTSSSRSYWDAAQGGGGPFNAVEIPTIPVAVTVFPGEIYRAPQNWAEQCFDKLIYWNEAKEGGHFAALEKPEIFATEVQAAFRPLHESEQTTGTLR